MNRNKTTAIIAILAALVAAGYLAAQALYPASGKYDDLAKCLTANGVIMYGQSGCHACAYQMEILGPSFRYINEVDCLQQRQACDAQQITLTPTWLINSTFHVGVLTPEQLSELSGCSI